MLNKEQILEYLKELINENNREHIIQLIDKIEKINEEELNTVLSERKIKTLRDVRKMVVKGLKQPRTKTNKFSELNELVSYGVTGKTIHIHVVPKDAKNLLTREGMKKAELALIDATEKIKLLIQTSNRYGKIENIYAVSGIISGPVARWFKNIGYDVKTLPIEDAKKDRELGRFYGMFKEAKKLGRATLSKEKLMCNEWEVLKDARKVSLGIENNKQFENVLKNLNATSEEILLHEEILSNISVNEREKQNKEEI